MAALNDATLALVEQQRIANLIALASSTDSIAARAQAEITLFERVTRGSYLALLLRPDIAAALGIKAVDDE